METINNTECFFVSDLHGNKDKYLKLFSEIEKSEPALLFIGGDILPSGLMHFTSNDADNFIEDFLAAEISGLKERLKSRFPKIFLIMGNDDSRIEEQLLIKYSEKNLWNYIHFNHTDYKGYKIFGYNYVPPTPFRLKDWERYDVSRFVDLGCISPEEGSRTVDVSDYEKKYSTIKQDLITLTKDQNLENAIFLFHAPPYQTNLDRAALDGKKIDYAPLDVHVGSIAVKRFIEKEQPLLCLHGHIHESTSITKSWQEKIGKTFCFNASHNGKELSIIKFQLENLEASQRILV